MVQIGGLACLLEWEGKNWTRPEFSCSREALPSQARVGAHTFNEWDRGSNVQTAKHQTQVSGVNSKFTHWGGLQQSETIFCGRNPPPPIIFVRREVILHGNLPPQKDFALIWSHRCGTLDSIDYCLLSLKKYHNLNLNLPLRPCINSTFSSDFAPKTTNHAINFFTQTDCSSSLCESCTLRCQWQLRHAATINYISGNFAMASLLCSKGSPKQPIVSSFWANPSC